MEQARESVLSWGFHRCVPGWYWADQCIESWSQLAGVGTEQLGEKDSLVENLCSVLLESPASAGDKDSWVEMTLMA